MPDNTIQLLNNAVSDLAYLNEVGIQHMDTMDEDELVAAMVAIRDLRHDLANLSDDVESALLKRHTNRKFVVEGIGEVEIKKAKKYSDWDNEGLTAVVVARALDERILDESSGEYEAGFAAVARVLSECSRPSWRLTALRARGIDESEYCHIEEGALSVRLPPRQP